MRILFCDDNPEILDQLQKYVTEFFKGIGKFLPEMAAYTSGDDLLLKERYADIAFLDVEMPGRSGIHVGARLKEYNPKIKVFIVTSFPDYLDEAMRFQVFRYLSKPIDKSRLFRNLKDAVYLHNMETHVIPVTSKDGVVALPADQFVCVETDSRKTYIYTPTDKIQSVESIEKWKEKLTLPCFYMPYRSFIINMQYVVSFSKDSIQLRCGDTIKEAYLAKRKYNEFKDRYLIFMESIR